MGEFHLNKFICIVISFTLILHLVLFCGKNPVKEDVQAEKINGREYIYENGKWYQIDRDSKFEVVPEVITIRFKSGVNDDQINSFLEEKNLEVLRKNILGFYDLKMKKEINPIQAVRDFLSNPIIEIAELGTYGRYTNNGT